MLICLLSMAAFALQKQTWMASTEANGLKRGLCDTTLLPHTAAQ